MKYVVACSFGNDSIALIQYMLEAVGSRDFFVLYNDTGWASTEWTRRVSRLSTILLENGISLRVTKSEGMEALVRRKKGWPMPASKMQFCTQELKEKPTEALLSKIDPNGDLIIVTGRRREESQNRASLPTWQYESKKHGGRDVWNPIAQLNGKERNDLVARFGIDPLPHSSQECHPCVCANKSDLASIPKDDPRIAEIERIEIEMGFTRNKKPRTMFRPYRVGGGVGIRQAIEWGHGPRGWKASHTPKDYEFSGGGLVVTGETDEAYESTENTRQCDGGFCGN